jgi:hypothetical protein
MKIERLKDMMGNNQDKNDLVTSEEISKANSNIR